MKHFFYFNSYRLYILDNLIRWGNNQISRDILYTCYFIYYIHKYIIYIWFSVKLIKARTYVKCVTFLICQQPRVRMSYPTAQFPTVTLRIPCSVTSTMNASTMYWPKNCALTAWPSMTSTTAWKNAISSTKLTAAADLICVSISLLSNLHWRTHFHKSRFFWFFLFITLNVIPKWYYQVCQVFEISSECGLIIYHHA